MRFVEPYPMAVQQVKTGVTGDVATALPVLASSGTLRGPVSHSRIIAVIRRRLL